MARLISTLLLPSSDIILAKVSAYLMQFFAGNEWSNQCVDSAAKRDDLHKSVGLWPCHNQVIFSLLLLLWSPLIWVSKALSSSMDLQIKSDHNIALKHNRLPPAEDVGVWSV